jgi:PAS domain S-box-containing protein
VSPSAQALLGYSVEELLALPMTRLMTSESAVRAADDVRRYLALCRDGPVDVPLLEYEYVRKDGTTFWGELKVGFLRDEHGEVTGLQGVLRDVSWRKQAEQERERLSSELRQAEKMQAIGQLASGVAHDFNNQLTVIQGYADMLGADRSSDPLTRRAAEQIAAAARRSADLTEQLLAFGRRGAARTVALDLHQTISEAVRLLERSVDPRIRIRAELAASPSVVVGDPSQLCTALLNLGLNARDAMPEGGEIVFSTALAEPVGAPAADAAPAVDEASAEEASATNERWIEVRVTDTGFGMDEQTLRRAFEPFFTTKPPGRGTGMGLAAVYGTVSAHGGTVQAESSPRRGTSMTIRLPLTKDGTAAPTSSRSDEAVPAAALRVLLIDDEPQVCDLAQQILAHGGFRVHAFTDAAEAIGFFEAHADDVELAVLDLTMPAMTGTQCLAALQRIAPGLPALFISGDAPSELARHLIEQRRCGFLPKPFRAADLLASARRAAQLSGSRGGAETARSATSGATAPGASDAGARRE